VQNNLKDALLSYEESIKIFEELGDEDNKNRVLTNLVNIFVVQENHEYQGNLISLYEKLYTSFKGKRMFEQSAKIQNNLGLVYQRKNNYKEAINHFKQGLEELQYSDESHIRAKIYRNLGDSYKELKCWKMASKNYSNASKIFNSLNEINSLSEVKEAQKGVASKQKNFADGNLLLASWVRLYVLSFT
jgi:tetratricopeptide (TPR) repeat protein